jgi:hypothetical protein
MNQCVNTAYVPMYWVTSLPPSRSQPPHMIVPRVAYPCRSTIHGLAKRPNGEDTNFGPEHGNMSWYATILNPVSQDIADLKFDAEQSSSNRFHMPPRDPCLRHPTSSPMAGYRRGPLQQAHRCPCPTLRMRRNIFELPVQKVTTVSIPPTAQSPPCPHAAPSKSSAPHHASNPSRRPLHLPAETSQQQWPSRLRASIPHWQSDRSRTPSACLMSMARSHPREG